MQHIFVIDPFSSLVPGHDSSLVLMKSALAMEHKVWQAQLADVTWQENAVNITAHPVYHQNNALYSEKQATVHRFDNASDYLIWMRKDPPVDESYIRVCQILRLTNTPVINDPNTLMQCDEKLFALEFPNLTPQTTISQNMRHIRNMVLEQEQLIAKPIGGKGGEGIVLLQRQDKNLNSLIELLTHAGDKKIILQQYIKDAYKGDKRIFLLAGDPIGAVLRVPNTGENRANMAVGCTLAQTTLTEREQQICSALKPRLLQLGLHIVGLDVISEQLTEINITSPTCLEEIGRLDHSDLAQKIIQWSERFPFKRVAEEFRSINAQNL